MTVGIQLIWTSILAYSIIQGFILFLLFPTFRQGSGQAKWLLALLSLLSALMLLEGFVDTVIGYATLPHLIFAFSPFWYALGPLLFAYIRLYATARNVRWIDLLHFLPMVIALINTLDFYQLPPEFKLQYLQNVEQNDIHPVHNINYIIFSIQCLVYLVAATVMLVKNNVLKSGKDESRWLLLLVLILGLITIQSIFSLIVLNNFALTGWNGSLYYVALSFFLVFLFIRSMRSPKTIYLIGRPVKFNIDPNETLSDFRKIEEFIRANKPYLDHEYGVEHLARQTRYSRHHITKLIKEHTRKSFRDYINQFRIDEVKHRLKSSQSELYTIEFIAIESGFSSQATFYRVFRKIEGMTPGSFMKNEYQMV